MDYGSFSTPYPSTLGLILSGYHLAKKDKVTLVDKVPDFKRFHIVYIVKDSLNLYHLPYWLTFHNVVPVGRFWDEGVAVWENEWINYPPDMSLYKEWFDKWKVQYPWFNEVTRAGIFSHKPVLIKNNLRFFAPTGDKILIIDHEPHKINPQHKFLYSLKNESLTFLHPFNITEYPEESFKLLIKENIKNRTWLTFDRHLSQPQMFELASKWKKFPFSYKNEALLKLTQYFGQNDAGMNGWLQSLSRTWQIVKLWKKVAKKRIYSIPIDDLSFECPDLLKHMQSWTGTPILFRKFSYVDSLLIFSLPSIEVFINFLRNPQALWATPTFRNQPLYIKSYRIFTFLEKYPEFLIRLSEFIEGDCD